MINYIDLFHGIGGFALGAYWAGMKFDHHFCSDIEPYCQKLYKLRFPDSIQLGDITKIDTEELKKYGTDWIITGGFPCQDISIAGKGAGITGARSGLWFEYWRLIRDLRPRFAIMENVGELIRRGLREVLGSLAEIGYDAEWQDIRASDVGAPHRRERIWIVAYPAAERRRMVGMYGMERSVSRKSVDECCEIDGKIPHASLQLSHGNGPYGGDVADASIQRLQGQEPARGGPGESGLPAECDWWATEPDVGRLAHGIPARVDRLKGLGNAIVPQIAELLFRQIKHYI